MTSKFGGLRASNVLSYQSTSYRAEDGGPVGGEADAPAGDEGYSIAPTINLFTSPTAKNRALNPVDPFPEFEDGGRELGSAKDPFPDNVGPGSKSDSLNAEQLLNDLEEIDRAHGGYIKPSSYGVGNKDEAHSTIRPIVPMPNNTDNYTHNFSNPATGAAMGAPSSSATARPSRARAAEREANQIQSELNEIEAQRSALAAQQSQQMSLANAVQNDLNQQKEELRQLMEAVRLEKREIALRYELQEKEKERQKREEAERAEQRDNTMQEALEVLRAQNQMLATRIEERENEAYRRLEEEREARKQELQLIEENNRKRNEDAIRAQMETEVKLAKEREELRQALKSMELEKSKLAERISATEEAARQDAVLMEMQRKEFNNRVEAMEKEREVLKSMVTDNEAKAREATEETAKKLAEEREATLQKIKAMEDERTEWAQNLARTEEQVKSHAASLADQLAAEKREMAEKVEAMEKEKLDMAQQLMSTEKAAQEEVATKTNEVVREKAELKEALERVERDKLEMLGKLSILEADQQAKKEAEAEQRHRQEADEKQEQEAATRRLAEEATMQKIRDEMSAKFAEFANEKLELAEKLRVAEEQAALREKLMAEKLEKEREELQKSVQKMKEEFFEERRQKLERERADNSATTGTEGASALSPKMGLIAKRSLYDLLGDSGASDAATASAQTKVSRDITTVEEGNEDEVPNPAPSPGAGQERGVPPVPPELEGLPAPHTAAATGDLRRLRSLANLESTLLSSFDTANRSPLFYAVAYNQPDAAAYIIDSNPAILTHADGHGDTVLHAASSTGSVECLEVLLNASKRMGDDAHSRYVSVMNGMNMTPAHLALNRDVMSLLAINGANLSALDKNGRSPLFIACAMNRADCAEFLIDALDHDEASLYYQDSRGDTPLHAAACNGAVDCVLLLLQYGVDPRTTNKKELKAIDLALRNKQGECREILAEYHLHFCTSSAFDSVLFLATLEGHKQVKHSIGENGYQIIKVSGTDEDDTSVGSGASHPTEAKKQLRSVQSMFSLKKNKSLRLQRWGSWIAYEDQDDASKVYWYNHSTNEGQWEVPESVAKLKASGDSKRTLASKASMRLKRMGDWIQYMTESNNTFYYNEKTGEFQWASPNDSGSGPAEQQQGADPTKTSDWKPYKDPDTGGIFWYNAVTQVSQWDCPFTAPSSSPVLSEAEVKAAHKASSPSRANAGKELSGATASLRNATGDDIGVGATKPQGSPNRQKLRVGENPFALDDDSEDEAVLVSGDDDLGI